MLNHLTALTETIANTFPCITPMFYPYYKKLVQDEIALAKLNREDHILFIGAGALPISALLILAYTDANITLLDNNTRAYIKAKRLIKKLKLTHKINLINDCGSKCDLSHYTAVHIAKQVFPKNCVLNHVLTHANKETKIIVRSNEATTNNTQQTTTFKRRWVKQTCLYVT